MKTRIFDQLRWHETHNFSRGSRIISEKSCTAISAYPVRKEGKREIKIGSCLAYYYPEEKIVEIWECFFFSMDRKLLRIDYEDAKKLFKTFEEELTRRYDPEKIYAREDEPSYTEGWMKKILEELGYKPSRKNLYMVKSLKRK